MTGRTLATPAASRLAGAASAMIAASGLLALTTLLAKALGRGIDGEALHPLQITAGRFGFALLCLSILCAWRPPSFANAAWSIHALRSVFGWLGVTCMFTAAALMPLAEATAISFLSPVAAMILAVLFLRERVGPSRWFAAAIAFSGVLLLIRPGTEAFQPAALVALIAAVAMGTEATLIKRLSGREPMLRILVINNSIGSTIAITAALFVWQSPTTAQWGLMALLGGTMLAAQGCFIAAMQRADASYVMPFMYTTLIFAAVYDFVVFGDRTDAIGGLGAAVIVGGALLLAWRERRRARLGRL